MSWREREDKIQKAKDQKRRKGNIIILSTLGMLDNTTIQQCNTLSIHITTLQHNIQVLFVLYIYSIKLQPNDNSTY